MKKKAIIALILLAFVALLSYGCTDNANKPFEPSIKNTTSSVMTDKGEIKGYINSDAAIFKGIPFAKPPKGDLRFAPPQPADPWKSVLKCTEYKNPPMQVQAKNSDTVCSEDCLYLNIWTPKNAIKKTSKENLPVLVFIHGGAFAGGKATKDTYDGSAFARDGIIEVTIEYRLNVLGFLALEEMDKAYGSMGNLGTLDQIAALKWIQRNISNFGGDPNNVTICGESAGAFSVSNLIMSKEAEGLFNKAIMESGSLFGQKILSPKSPGDKNQAMELSEMFKKKLGVNSLTDLRKINPQTLVNASAFSMDMSSPTDCYFFPTFDGKIIPKNPYKELLAGNYNHVPILTGFNTDEGSLFIPKDITEATYISFLNEIFGKDAEKVLARYPVDENHTPANRGQFIVKMAFQMGSFIFGDAYSDQGKDIYIYNFDYHIPTLDEKNLGVIHGSEMNFVFDTVPPNLNLPKNSRSFTDTVHGYWASFVKTGNPNSSDGLPENHTTWSAYNTNTKEIMKLNSNSEMVTAPDQEDIYFFIDLLWRDFLLDTTHKKSILKL